VNNNFDCGPPKMILTIPIKKLAQARYVKLLRHVTSTLPPVNFVCSRLKTQSFNHSFLLKSCEVTSDTFQSHCPLKRRLRFIAMEPIPSELWASER